MKLLTKPYKVLYSKLLGYVIMAGCASALLMTGNYLGMYALPLPESNWIKYAIIMSWQLAAVIVVSILEGKMRRMEEHLDRWAMRPLLWIGFMTPWIWYVTLLYFVNYGVLWAISITFVHLAVHGTLLALVLRRIKKELVNQEKYHVNIYETLYEDLSVVRTPIVPVMRSIPPMPPLPTP